MYFGIDSDGNKVHIENSVKGDSYSCPICGTPLIRKFGSIVSHHFAHKSAQCDPWYHDNKGPWHKEMQSHFRPEQCEVRIDGKCGEFHIADVFIEHTDRPNTIIEFQHSSISIEEFDKRNDFYTTNNTNDNYDYNEIIWVFDYNHKDMFIDIFKYSYIQNLFEEERKLEEKERLFEQKCAAIYAKREKYAQINPLEPKDSPLRKEAEQNRIDMEQTWIERKELQKKRNSIQYRFFNLPPIEPQKDPFCYELIKHIAEAKLRKNYHLKYKTPVEELYFGRDHIAHTTDWLIYKNNYILQKQTIMYP